MTTLTITVWDGKEALASTQVTKQEPFKMTDSSQGRVRVGLAERLSRAGTFSSVELRCEIELPTDVHTKKALDNVCDTAFEKCVEFIDEHIDQALEMLDTHGRK